MSVHTILISRLSEILPPQRLITDPKRLHSYNSDHAKDFSGRAGALVLPQESGEVSRILSLCNELDFPVYTRGAGTGVTGAAVPLDDGLVLSCERMNQIIEIDSANMTATVEPFVITGVLQDKVEKAGLFYPPDPASLDECTIGGNVSQNAGGPRAVKYGVTRDYVLGIECVLADGTIIHTGGKFVKNSTGYNLAQLITGSEGTLCVMTRLTLKLIPRPVHECDLLIPFSSLQEAVDTVGEILNKRITPSTIEFIEDEAIRLVRANRDDDIPFTDARAYLIVKIDAGTREERDSQLSRLFTIGAINRNEVVIAYTAAESKRVWEIRRGIRGALNHFSPVFFAEDCVVPRAEIARFITTIKAAISREGLRSVLFGHAGDGNIHIDVLKDNTDNESWLILKDKIRAMLYDEALKHGGQISGEHGIGYTKRDYLERAVGKREYDLMRQIKQVFDPKNILNRGKLFT